MHFQKEAMLYKQTVGNSVECDLCAYRCKIDEGNFGICGVRQNSGGKLYTVAYGKVIAAHIDPIEKKPLYHFLPGTTAFSVATMGCNFKCAFCQNWQISQATKEGRSDLQGEKLSPENAVNLAKNRGCKSIAYTYTEPTIFFEYAYDTAKLAKDQGLYNIFVTNGFMTHEALETIQPYLDAANIDLKSFRDDFYNKMCKARLQPVLDSIKLMKKLGIWVEVTTLIVPGQNDTEDELNRIAEFIASVSENIPWHISRFHPDYEYTDSEPTPLETIENARRIGKAQGIKHVYMGNILTDSNTYCPQCGELLIKRGVFGNSKIILEEGKCPKCDARIEGKWK